MIDRVPKWMTSVARTAVVTHVVCVVDWALGFAGLKGEVEHLPRLARQDSRCT